MCRLDRVSGLLEGFQTLRELLGIVSALIEWLNDMNLLRGSASAHLETTYGCAMTWQEYSEGKKHPALCTSQIVLKAQVRRSVVLNCHVQ